MAGENVNKTSVRGNFFYCKYNSFLHIVIPNQSEAPSVKIALNYFFLLLLAKLIYFINFIFLSSFPGVHSEAVKITSINHQAFEGKKVEAAKLICAINVPQKICVFNSPSGSPYGVIEGAK